MNCLFCKIVNGEIKSTTLYEDDFVKVIMDINPECDGHTLIIPKNHYNDFTEIPKELWEHIYKVAKKIGNELSNKLQTKGYRFVINYGDYQEIKHFHLHILPNPNKKATLKIEEAYSLLTTKKTSNSEVVR